MAETAQYIDNSAAPPPVYNGKSLADLKAMFDEFRSVMALSRKQCAIDDDYWHGKQLTSDELNKLNSRGQPDIVNNRVRVAVNGTTGIISHSRTDPKAWPRTQQDDTSASVATDVLRYVTQKQRFNRLKTECARDYLVPGTAALMVIVDPDTKDIKYVPIRWEEYWYDPRSRRNDLSDKRYDGVAKWMYSDMVADMYKNRPVHLEGGLPSGSTPVGGISGTGAFDDTFGDRPINQDGKFPWIGSNGGRVMVVEAYYQFRSTWTRCVFWDGGILEEGVSPYLDERKRPTDPIEPVSCYVDRDNNRYGIVRDMRDMQDEINKRRSKLLHLVNTSQIQARDPSAIEVSADTARLEAARPDGVIPYGWEKVPTSDMAQGQSALLAEAKAEMERFGPNPAVLGRQGADTSGRALLARQQAGLIELAVVLEQLEDWELRVYRATWARVKQFWTDPMIIRITDDVEDPRFIQVNQPKTGPAPMIDPESGQPVIDPATGQPVMYEAVLGYENQLAEMDVDIVIDTTPATATIMQEMLQDLMQLMGTNPAYAQQVPFEVIIGLMPIPRKRDIIKQIQKFRAEQEQAQKQQQDQQIQIAVETAMAKIGHISSQTAMNEAKADKLRAETTKTGIDASNETAKTVHEVSQDPEDLKKPASGAKSGDSAA